MYLCNCIALNPTNTMMINLDENQSFHSVATLLSLPLLPCTLCKAGAKRPRTHWSWIGFYLVLWKKRRTSPGRPQWWKAAQSPTEGRQDNAEPSPAGSRLPTKRQGEVIPGSAWKWAPEGNCRVLPLALCGSSPSLLGRERAGKALAAAVASWTPRFLSWLGTGEPPHFALQSIGGFLTALKVCGCILGQGLLQTPS